MKFTLIIFVFISVVELSNAQADSLKRVQEINQQVWKPFISALTSRNNPDFRKLHSKRITRVEIDNNLVQDYDHYFKENYKKQSNDKSTRLFELRFDKRIGSNTREWESGYYKSTVIQPGKEARVYYGKFFVLLEKENGVWKILLDADTSQGATEQAFNEANNME